MKTIKFKVITEITIEPVSSSIYKCDKGIACFNSPVIVEVSETPTKLEKKWTCVEHANQNWLQKYLEKSLGVYDNDN